MGSFLSFVQRASKSVTETYPFVILRFSCAGTRVNARPVTQSFKPPAVPKSTDTRPLQFGILSTADISTQSLILQARSHPGVEIYAVAGRSKEKVDAFAKKSRITKVYSGPEAYQTLIDDPRVDAVYIPLPNVLHYEWTMKALSEGKHVLVEKPIANTPEEAQKMHDLAEKKGVVLLEGMHIRFHPAIHRVKAIIEGGDIGALQHISTTMFLPSIATKGYKPTDFHLGKGAVADIGCYTLDIIRFLSSSDPLSITSTSYTSSVENMDDISQGTLELPNDVTAAYSCNISTPPLLGFIPKFDFSVEAQRERGTVKLSEYMMPSVYHSITVTKSSGEKRTYKGYTFEGDSNAAGEEWWSTFRHQLEAFVIKVKGDEPKIWLSKEDSVAEMEWLQKIYQKMGLDPQPESRHN